MILQDDRTPDQRKTHTIIIAMTDRFMSGWGQAQDGTSYAGWACEPQDAATVLDWVHGRTDAMRVREVGTNWRPQGQGHTHIYVVKPGHPALSGWIHHG